MLKAHAMPTSHAIVLANRLALESGNRLSLNAISRIRKTLEGLAAVGVREVAVVDGRAVLVFNCLNGELSDGRRVSDPGGGIWTVPIDDLTGPYDITRATRLTDSTLYAGRLVQDRAGDWNLLAFRNRDVDGRFVGGLSDPLPVSWIGDRLCLAAGMPGAAPR